jgi:hypothetical protein
VVHNDERTAPGRFGPSRKRVEFHAHTPPSPEPTGPKGCRITADHRNSGAAGASGILRCVKSTIKGRRHCRALRDQPQTRTADPFSRALQSSRTLLITATLGRDDARANLPGSISCRSARRNGRVSANTIARRSESATGCGDMGDVSRGRYRPRWAGALRSGYQSQSRVGSPNGQGKAELWLPAGSDDGQFSGK